MYGKIRFHARIVSKLVSVHHCLKYKMMTIFSITAELQDIQVDRKQKKQPIRHKELHTLLDLWTYFRNIFCKKKIITKVSMIF